MMEPPAGTGALTEERAEPPGVRGERGLPLASAVHNLQARLSSLLATGLMIALGVAALAWYYAHALNRPTRVRQNAQAAALSRAQGESPLPSLGRIVLPPAPAREATVATTESATPTFPESVALISPASGTAELPSGPPPKTSAQLAVERRLSGAVFAHESQSPPTAAPVMNAVPAETLTAGAPGISSGTPAAGERAPSLGALLTPTAASATRAQQLPSERLLLPKGAFIDCTLETAIDSTLPGMTTCITAADTFGADGKVVLLERGTKLVGETRGRVQQGQARVFVLWTEARTPTGVIVPLDSPGTDELGRAGLPGEVDRHFWERFGAAILVSLIDGVVQARVQAASRPGATVVYPSGATDVMTEVLKETIGIPPTVRKRNGDRIQVLVARNVDFRSVYELRGHAAAR
jgi:type IV secretion system protein VirB10